MGDPAAAPEAMVRATQLSHTLRGRACLLSVSISFGWLSFSRCPWDSKPPAQGQTRALMWARALE